MKNFIAFAFFVSVLVTGFNAAQAMPVAPLDQDPGGSIVQVYGGCGYGGHRGPYGGCRPL
jgi:membrane-associated protease RseP (regulator of RpoE activity)